MAEKSFLGFAITLTIVCAGLVVFPTSSYEVSLVTSPDRESFHIPAGEPFNITCRGSGDDAKKFSSLKWINNNGSVIPTGIPGTVEELGNSLTLMFSNPKEEESGVYKCIAAYENKDTLQKSVSIFFQGGKPIFDNSFENLTAKENSPLEIICLANGEEPITYEWYNQNEEKITQNSKSSIFVKNRNKESDLVIPKVALSHTGLYTCLASNKHGSSSKIFQLNVLSSNASFQDALILNVTTTNVKFAFNVSGPVQHIEAAYREDRSDQVKYFKFPYGRDYEIKDLVPAGRYIFKFRTSPSVNNEWSKAYAVVLLPEKPEVIFRTISSGTVKLEWLFKFGDRMKKTIDRHEISYSSVQMVSGESWKPGTCPITIHLPTCTSSSYTISGLSTGAYYEIQLRAHTAGGYSEPFSQKIFFPSR